MCSYIIIPRMKMDMCITVLLDGCNGIYIDLYMDIHCSLSLYGTVSVMGSVDWPYNWKR